MSWIQCKTCVYLRPNDTCGNPYDPASNAKGECVYHATEWPADVELRKVQEKENRMKELESQLAAVTRERDEWRTMHELGGANAIITQLRSRVAELEKQLSAINEGSKP